MRRFSFRPALTLRGRQFKGIRGWAGKPLHPPLTDIPIGAYLIGGGLDLISFVGHNESWAREVYRGGTYTITGGLFVSVFTALTGFWDWYRSTEKGTQARRTANAHAVTMVTVTLLVLADVGLRWFAYYDDGHTGVLVLSLSLAAALLTVLGGTIGGELVYDFGFNVETAGDSVVWHRSEVDVYPFEKRADETSAPPALPSDVPQPVQPSGRRQV